MDLALEPDLLAVIDAAAPSAVVTQVAEPSAELDYYGLFVRGVAITLLVELAVLFLVVRLGFKRTRQSLSNPLLVFAGALLPRCAGRALEPGLFVGPGAVGIFVGVWMGSQAIAWQGILAGLLIVAGVWLWFVVPGEARLARRCLQTENFGKGTNREHWIPSQRASRLEESSARGAQAPVLGPAPLSLSVAIVTAFFLSVVIRGVVGGWLTGAWRESVPAGLALAVAAAGGKCLGGWAADRIGWRRAATLALVASAPLIFSGMHYLPLAIGGLLLFQSTMPVTLAATYALMPRWPGFAFGLPSLALLLGTLPAFSPWLRLHSPLVTVLLPPVILGSAALLWLGLSWGRVGPDFFPANPLAAAQLLAKRQSLELNRPAGDPLAPRRLGQGSLSNLGNAEL